MEQIKINEVKSKCSNLINKRICTFKFVDRISVKTNVQLFAV